MPEPLTIGRFRVVALLSSQPANVFHVVDPRNDEPRALHVIAIPDRAWADMLRHDLSALIALPIPGVVTIYEFELEDSSAYIVTEPLQKRLTLDRDGDTSTTTADRSLTPTFSRPGALALAGDYCRAVAALRARMITCVAALPSNLWHTANGTIKIGDFAQAPVSSSSTRTGATLEPGAVPFLAPELAKGC